MLRIGAWRCPVDHQAFRDSGPSSDTLFVFPRDSVTIQHEGRAPFVADANTVTYYNKGQRYRRDGAAGWGDRCEWFAIDPRTVADAVADRDPNARDRIDRVFAFTHGPSEASSYFAQRRVFDHVSREAVPDRLFVEETMLEVLVRVSALAYEREAMKPAVSRSKGDRDIAEAARELLARCYREDWSLSAMAGRIGASVFHLARVFQRRTGLSLHQYRNQLRMRAALEELAGGEEDLSGLALALGFSSHSHFTNVFRRTFGSTPSAYRGEMRPRM